MNQTASDIQLESIILVVHDVGRAERFLTAAIGLRVGTRLRDEHGAIITSQLTTAGLQVVLSGQDEHHRTASPGQSGFSAVTVVLRVTDVDTAVQQFVQAGGTLLSGPKERYWGCRAALLEDPDGHRWMLQTPRFSPSPEDIQRAVAPWRHELVEQ
jgi:uncharacterized glyoxalase superfamily protein PhnB